MTVLFHKRSSSRRTGHSIFQISISRNTQCNVRFRPLFLDQVTYTSLKQIIAIVNLLSIILDHHSILAHDFNGC